MDVGTIIYSRKHVYIGNNVAIAGKFYIFASNHSFSMDKLIKEQLMDTYERGIYMGDDVLINAQTIVRNNLKLIFSQYYIQ